MPHSLLEHIASPALIVHPETRIVLSANREAERLLGLSLDELHELPADRIWHHTDDGKQTAQVLPEAGKREALLQTGPFENTRVHVHFARISASGQEGILAVLEFEDPFQFRKNQAPSEDRSGPLQLTDALPNGLLFCDREGKIEFVNRALCDLFGYERHELEGHPLEILVPDEYREAHRRHVSGYFKQPEMRPMGSELYLSGQRKNGSRFPVDIQLSPWRNRIMAIVRDITTEIQLQHSLKREKESVQLLQEITSAANRADTFHEAMGSAIVRICRFLNWPVGHIYQPDSKDETMVSSGIWYIEEQEQLETFRQHTERQIFNTGEGLIGSVWQEKRPIWLSDSSKDPYYVRREAAREAGLQSCLAVPVLTGINQQVSAILEFYTRQPAAPDDDLLDLLQTAAFQLSRVYERRQANRQLIEQQEQLQQLFDNSPVGMVKLDPDYRIRMLNNSFKTLFGYSGDELLGRPIDTLIAEEQYADEARELSDKTGRGEITQRESVRTARDGTEIPVLVIGVPVVVDGETIAIFALYVDLSERKRAEQAVQEALSVKETLLSEIHHRVKNNLSQLSSFLQLQSQTTKNDEVQRVLAEADLRVRSIAIIYEQLYQTGSLHQLDFQEYIQDLLDAVNSAMNTENRVNLHIHSDSFQLGLYQAIPCALIINELVTNAFKYAFNGEAGNITVRVTDLGKTVSTEVRDDGKGLPSGFDSEKAESFGFTILQILMQQLQADYKITSREDGKGTQVHFSFEKKDYKG